MPQRLSGVTRAVAPRHCPERPAGRGQRHPLSRPRAARGQRLKHGVMLGIDRQDRGAGSRTRRMNSSPAQTRHSLLAMAIRRPGLTAASVGSSPAAPTIPATTISAGAFGRGEQSFFARRCLNAATGERFLEFAVATASPIPRALRFEFPRERRKPRRVAPRRDRRQRKFPAHWRNSSKRAIADRAGRTENRNPPHHRSSPAAGDCAPPFSKPDRKRKRPPP
jgi:hypothetical protein